MLIISTLACLIGALAGGAVVAKGMQGLNRWVEYRARNTAQAAGEFEAFRQSLKALLVDGERVSPMVKAALVVLTAEAARPRLASHVERQVRRGKVQAEVEDTTAIGQAVNGLPADLREAYNKCITAALWSSASMHPFRADRLRSLLLLAARQATERPREAQVTENAERVVGVYISRKKRHGPHDGGDVISDSMVAA